MYEIRKIAVKHLPSRRKIISKKMKTMCQKNAKLTGCGDMAAQQNNQVYLLPIFIKNTINALGYSQKNFFEEVQGVINKHFYDVQNQLRELGETLTVLEKETKKHQAARNLIRKVQQAATKISNQDGVRRLTVLSDLEELVKALNGCPELGKWNVEILLEIVEMEELFSPYYNSGIEDRTFARILSPKEKPLTRIDKKTEIIIETFAKIIKKEEQRDFFFQQCLSPDCIDTIFFSYRRHRVLCYDTAQADYVTNMLLSLKNSTEESDWQATLTCIVRSLILKPYGVLNEPIESGLKNSNEDDIELPNWDAPEYTFFADFHVLASNYLSSGIRLMAFVPQKVQLSPQNTFFIVSKVFGILVKLHRENKINIADELDTELAHELILHSLHSQKRIHTNLCGAYKALCGGKIT